MRRDVRHHVDLERLELHRERGLLLVARRLITEHQQVMVRERPVRSRGRRLTPMARSVRLSTLVVKQGSGSSTGQFVGAEHDATR